MGYSRKVSRHARDVNRDYVTGKKRLINSGTDPIIAGAKAIGSISPGKIISLLIYTSVLPVLFDTVASLGGNFARLWDDDDEKNTKARWIMLFSATLGWTKGLLGIGFALEYALNQIQGVSYGKRDDNIIPVMDDTLDLLDAIIKTSNLLSKHNDETIKDRSEYEQELYKAGAKLGITGGGLFLGMPVTFMHRSFDVATQDEYENKLRMAARLYGVPKQELERIFESEKLEFDALVKKAKKFKSDLKDLAKTDEDEYKRLRDSDEAKIYNQILSIEKSVKRDEKSIKDTDDEERIGILQERIDNNLDKAKQLKDKP
jgi:hypothetical protein